MSVSGLSPDVLAAAAAAVLPEAVVRYVAAGSGPAVGAGWDRLALRPRALAASGPADTAVEVLGTPLATPVLVGPTASHAQLAPEAEPGTARGAREAGSLLVLSTRSSTPLESVAAAAGPWWFQLYVLRDRGLTRELAARAAAPVPAP